jgi:hypothetical protein
MSIVLLVLVQELVFVAYDSDDDSTIEARTYCLPLQ